jgi:hypothetical protein
MALVAVNESATKEANKRWTRMSNGFVAQNLWDQWRGGACHCQRTSE